MSIGDENCIGGIGSGFFYESTRRRYLVTNRHNVTGINPETKKSISKNGMLPTHIHCEMPLGISKDGKNVILEPSPFNLDLYRSDGTPGWLTHPVHNEYDVVAIPFHDDELIIWIAHLGKGVGLYLPTSVNKIKNPSTAEMTPGDDCFVIGYPSGIDGGRSLPIWKRASIASQPEFDQDGLPTFYIDTASGPGMSGSPVFYLDPFLPKPKHPGAVTRRKSRFVGVYSGRTRGSEFGGQLGRVWKKEVVDEVVEHGIEDTYRLP